MRNTNTLSIIALVFLASITTPNNVSATAPSAYGTLVGRCVSESTETRSTCFQKYARDRSGSRSPLGRVLAKRVKYVPHIRKTDGTPRFPKGAKRVEPLCLDYFDIQLRNAIDFGPMNAQRERALKAQLNRCAARTPTTGPMAADFGNTTYSRK
jgi:hypothetical protein